MKNIWEETLFPYNESSQSIQSWFHKINILLEDKNSKSSTLRTIIFLLSTKRISIFVKYYRKNSIFYDSIFYNLCSNLSQYWSWVKSGFLKSYFITIIIYYRIERRCCTTFLPTTNPCSPIIRNIFSRHGNYILRVKIRLAWRTWR